MDSEVRKSETSGLSRWWEVASDGFVRQCSTVGQTPRNVDRERMVKMKVFHIDPFC